VKSEITTTPAVTEVRTIMVPKTETVVVTPATKALTLTLDPKEAEHVANILGARNGVDSQSGATHDSSFEHRMWRALNSFLRDTLPGHDPAPRSTTSGAREVARNDAFRAAGGYPNRI
jgi:hypothetical protein